MGSQPRLRDEYIPFSYSCRKAEASFYNGDYEKTLQSIEELKEMVESKIESQSDTR